MLFSENKFLMKSEVAIGVVKLRLDHYIMERAGYTVPGLLCSNSKREITTYLRIFYDFIFSVSSLIIQENEHSHCFIWWMQLDFSSSMQLPHLAFVCCSIPGWWTYTPSFTLSSLMIEMFQKLIFFPFADGIWVSGDGHQVQDGQACLLRKCS